MAEVDQSSRMISQLTQVEQKSLFFNLIANLHSSCAQVSISHLILNLHSRGRVLPRVASLKRTTQKRSGLTTEDNYNHSMIIVLLHIDFSPLT